MIPIYSHVRNYHEAVGLPAPKEPTIRTRTELRDASLMLAMEAIAAIKAMGFNLTIQDEEIALSTRPVGKLEDQYYSITTLLYDTLSTNVMLGGEWMLMFDAIHDARMDPNKPLVKPRAVLEGMLIAGCKTCRVPGAKPPHFASPRCESGGYTHCSCDTCF